MKREDFADRHHIIDALIDRLKRSKKHWDKKDVDELLRLHAPLFKKACGQWSGLDSYEVYKTAQETLLLFLYKFNPKKGVFFNTFIRRAFWWELGRRLKKQLRESPRLSVDETTFDQDNLSVLEYYQMIRKTLGETDGDIYILKVLYSLKQQDISVLLSLSQRMVGEHWRKVKGFLRKKLQPN